MDSITLLKSVFRGIGTKNNSLPERERYTFQMALIAFIIYAMIRKGWTTFSIFSEFLLTDEFPYISKE